MASSKNILKAKKTCAYLRPANKWLLDLIYAEAEKAGFFPLPDQAVRLLWLTVQQIVRRATGTALAGPTRRLYRADR